MQSKRDSIIDATITVISGMIINFCVFQFILAPLMGIPVTYGQNAVITSVLTMISLFRHYTLRRIFCYLALRKCKKIGYLGD